MTKAAKLSASTDLIGKLKTARSVILSTHRQCDGDGLGAELAMYHGLKQLGLQVWLINVDRPARKYDFLGTDRLVQAVSETSVPKADLALVFDTNDRRLVEPLFSELETQCGEVIFIDHHPILTRGPEPTPGSVIDVTAASTGEIAFRILKELGVQFNAEIARALYVSVVFDTQMFRYVKGDPRSHLMAAELLRFERDPEEVHRRLFATYTIEKMGFLGRALTQVEYTASGRVAVLRLEAKDLRQHGLDLDEAADVIDLVMNIESVEAAALIREDTEQSCKLSLRSKGRVQVLPLAERLGGGGHPFAAGAYVAQDGRSLREHLVKELVALVDPSLRSVKG